MKKNLMKLALCLALAALTLGVGALAFAQSGTTITETKMKVDEATLKRMGIFVSNFTEQGFWEIESPAAMDSEDLVIFGIRHNYINNFKSRVQQKKDEHGDVMIDGKWVAESVKKYFDLPLTHGSALFLETGPYFYYDGQNYHFNGADGEAVYYARVRDVFQVSDGNIKMTGELYEVDGKDDATYPFAALAKPYKFGGKDTWSILSLHTDTE